VREFRWALLATAGSWFIFDVVFYANGLFSGTVLALMGIGGGGSAGGGGGGGGHRRALLAAPDDASQAAASLALAAEAGGGILLALIALPGYGLAVALIDRVGGRAMQLGGFAAMAALYALMAAVLRPLAAASPGSLLLLYGLSFTACHCGPNTTTFVIPAQAFPPRAKATCHGISAAAGKAGAALGAAAMAPLLRAFATPDDALGGLAAVLAASAAVAAAGWAWTWRLTHGPGTEPAPPAAAAAAGSATAAGARTPSAARAR
jgi:PHS family inorganic phosphate transporter-like MFS transporter